jgi:hypothetical protein
MHVETCQNRVTTGYTWLAAIAGGTRLIRRLPLLFELPSHLSQLYFQASRHAFSHILALFMIRDAVSTYHKSRSHSRKYKTEVLLI